MNGHNHVENGLTSSVIYLAFFFFCVRTRGDYSSIERRNQALTGWRRYFSSSTKEGRVNVRLTELKRCSSTFFVQSFSQIFKMPYILVWKLTGLNRYPSSSMRAEEITILIVISHVSGDSVY